MSKITRRGMLMSGLKGLGLIVGGCSGVGSLAGCYGGGYSQGNYAQNFNQPPRRIFVETLPEGIHIGSAWVDGYNGNPKDNEIQPGEILDRGKLTFTIGEGMLILGVIKPPYGRARLELCSSVTGKLLTSSGEQDIASRGDQAIIGYEKHFSPGDIGGRGQVTVRLIVNGAERNRKTITLID